MNKHNCCDDMENNSHTEHNHNHHDYKNREHKHNGMMSHGSAQNFLRRFWIVTFLLIPLLLTNEKVLAFIGISGKIYAGKWIQFIISTIIFGFALVFFKHAWHEIKSKKYGMMTLVSVAVGSGYLFSVASTFMSSLDTQFYLEISTLVWVLLFGHYLEARSSSAAGDAVNEAAKLLPKKAHRFNSGKEEDVDISDLVVGDDVLIKPGEKIPADGIIISGNASINEAFISGESKLIKKRENDKVFAGSICENGSVIMKVERVGADSTIGQIQDLISKAQETKPRSQRIADKASSILTAVAIITALLTILIWTFIIGQPFAFALTLAITVLVITCPHALGLAIPTVTTIATSLAIKNGVFVKDLSKIETIKKVDYVVFDKTGTLTEGLFSVSKIIQTSDVGEDKLLKIAISLGQYSSHIIDVSIIQYAKKVGIKPQKVSDFKSISGKGIMATIDGTRYILGSKKFMVENKLYNDKVDDVIKNNALEWENIIFISDMKQVLGIIILSDKIREESYSTVKKLHSMGIKVAMLTGDADAVASGVAKKLGVDMYFAEVLPEDKYKHIKKLQDSGNIVMMIGDGVNDAPALAQADIGVAIGAGTDVAVEAGDAVLIKNNPGDVVKLIILSRGVYKKMIQNLLWAFGYNIIAIPAAAGIFAKFGFFLRPEVGALAMSLSTVIVVINAFTLKKINLKHVD